MKLNTFIIIFKRIFDVCETSFATKHRILCDVDYHLDRVIFLIFLHK